MNDFVTPVVLHTRKFRIDFSGKNNDSDYKKFKNDDLEKARELFKTNTLLFHVLEMTELAVKIGSLIKKFLNDVLPPIYLDGEKVKVFDDTRIPSIYPYYKVDLSFDTLQLKTPLFPL